MNITEGIIRRPQKVIIYGPEGIGKSTLASQFPNPLFVDTEGSTAQLNVRRLDKPSSWTMLLQQIKYVAQNPSVCQTLVLDTADWAEALAIDHVVAERNWKSIEDGGYGKGYVYLKEQWAILLELLNETVNSGVNTVLTAHSQIKKFEQPDEMGSYDRYELKLDKRTSSITKEWADLILFCNYKTDIITDSKTKKSKATGGHRVMYTAHHPAWDAKNRHNLPLELDMDFKSIAHIFSDTEDVEEKVVQEAEKQPLPEEPPKHAEQEAPKEDPAMYDGIPKNLAELMFLNDVKEEEIRKAVHRQGYFPENTKIKDYDPGFINAVLVGAWDQVFEMIKNIREEEQNGLPFTL